MNDLDRQILTAFQKLTPEKKLEFITRLPALLSEYEQHKKEATE